ncbi:unnamed protein product [Sympodiomycopsis kandeliae]
MTGQPETIQEYLATLPEFQSRTSHSSPLPSLYSSLSSLRSSNPSAYRANVDWWNKHLSQSVAQGSSRTVKGKAKETDRLVLKVDEDLLDGWTIEEVGRPMGLATVVNDLSQSGHLIQLRAYLNSPTPFSSPLSSSSSKSRIPSARSVAGFVIGKPLWWALSQMGISGQGDEEEDEMREWQKVKGQWVVWANLEAVGEKVFKAHIAKGASSPLDCLYSLTSFKSLIADTNPELSETDIRVLLKYLSRDRKVASVESNLIKLSNSEYNDVEPITEDDRGLSSVKETHSKLSSQIDELSTRILTLETKSKEALHLHQKSKALSYLKERKLLSDLLDKRLGSKSTLDGILIKIEQTMDNITMMQSYATSDSVLKSLLSNESLKMENVENVMDNLAETLASQQEIDQVITQGQKGVNDEHNLIDEGELEQEMKKLEEEEKQQREEEERQKKKAEAEEEERQKRMEEQEKQDKIKEDQTRKQEPEQDTQSKNPKEAVPEAREAITTD